MRRIMAIAMALLLCGGALAEGVPGNRLGLKVLSELTEGEANAFVSPVSLGYALSLAAAGAEGETLEQLLAALDAEDAESISGLNAALMEAGLKWANAAFVREGVSLKEAYAERVTRSFDAECFPLDDAERVNAWVDQRTDGLIDALIDRVPADVQLMLVNAVAMDAKWVSPFLADRTAEDDFHAPDGDVRVEFMHQKTYAQYGETAGTQFIRKPYEGGRLSMLLALPPEGKVAGALKGLKDKGLDYFQFDAQPQQVQLSLPKLDLAVSFDLTEALMAAGIEAPFSEAADFSGVSDTSLAISQVLQKLRVIVDEEGTRAAAATEVLMANGMSVSEPEPVEMNLNRPFLLAIADDGTGAILFAGVVANPAV